jgi:predicted transcriptional regulator
MKAKENTPHCLDGGYIDIKELSARMSLSVRTLRILIKQPNNPLPAYKVVGKLIFHWAEVTKWVEQFRVKTIDTKAIVQSITAKLKESNNAKKTKSKS